MSFSVILLNIKKTDKQITSLAEVITVLYNTAQVKAPISSFFM